MTLSLGPSKGGGGHSLWQMWICVWDWAADGVLNMCVSYPAADSVNGALGLHCMLCPSVFDHGTIAQR